MDTLSSMRVFATVVELGGFTAAAERLGVSRAMASKHVQHLEDHLGTRLLHRTTRKLALTESGTAYHERCVQILGEIEEAEAGAARGTVAPRGVLRVTLPVSFSVRHMGPLISEYMARYPEVTVDAYVSDRRVHLIEEGFDLALRVGPSPESSLIARRLASDRVVICASPDYLAAHGTPQHPRELVGHNCAIYSYSAQGNEWHLSGPDGPHTVRVSGRVRANNGDLLNQIVASGHGVMCQPRFLVGDEIRNGRLVEILSDYPMEPVGIYAMYPSRRHLSAKVRSFVEFLAARFAARGEWC